MTDYDLTDENQVEEYLRNIETEYSYQCLSEKDPDGCHRLADFLYTIRKDVKLGVAIFKRNCDELRNGQSCLKYAGIISTEKGDLADPDTGAKYFSVACDLGVYRGCSNAGWMYLTGHKVPPNKELGIEHLERSCQYDQKEACSLLGSSYLTGSHNVGKDPMKALSYLIKGCELGSYTACGNLSRMYRVGDGVNADPIKTAEYKKRAKQLYSNLVGDDAVHIKLGQS